LDKTIKLASDEEAIALYGRLDERLRYVEDEFKVRVSAQNHKLTVSGAKQNVKRAVDFFGAELDQIRSLGSASSSSKQAEKRESDESEGSTSGTGPSFFLKGKVLKARSKNQESYLRAIQKHDIVIGIGPAGTGKTYLAVAAAVDALKHKRVSRIVLTRPAVEAGENLGFLPGDLQQKINPYLRPLYDALYDMLDFNDVTRFLQRGTIEVAPLAYMRGRTLNDSFVILDEGQNCTHAQMKMFLTRLGASSRAVVTGDITQIDLPKHTRSGLVEVQKILYEVEEIRFVYFDGQDVVRHRLVQDIIRAYDKHDRK
jgi:phosphate starvation-inducible protein PhoH and related proteins